MNIAVLVLPHLMVAATLLGLLLQTHQHNAVRRASGRATFTEWLWRVARWRWLFLYGSAD